jgi:hypothetical protein
MNIIVTTIQAPTKAMRMLAAGLQNLGTGTLWVIGDRKGPSTFELPQTKFFDIGRQCTMGLKLAEFLPEGHYTRKNLGYLAAIREGADVIVETDDDNLPREDFFSPRSRFVEARQLTTSGEGWCNAYKAFTNAHIWPRGLPLETVRTSEPRIAATDGPQVVESLIQQGLADQNPDVDAVYRLILPLPLDFRREPPVNLPASIFCPFNSQNTTFFREAFPLLYLPSFCSFRMTDIWRSLVAQRCLWEMGSTVTFHAATVWQERNEHNLLRDFEDEIPGYLHNETIRVILENLKLQKGRDVAVVCSNLHECYQALTAADIVGKDELRLVDNWVKDISTLI